MPSQPEVPLESPDSTASERRGRLAVALLLLCIALGLRLKGIDQGLPHHGEPDAYILQQASSMIHGGVTDREYAGWKYPHLVGTILALAAPEPVERLGPGATLAEHSELATRLRKRGRIVVAVIASFAAPATYLVAARFLAGRFAFLAGLLVASSLLHICFSVQARPHAVVSTFSTLAILSAIRWRESPSLWRALLLGLSVAASVSTLHSGTAALAPAGAALLGLLRGGAPKGRVALGALLAATIVAVSAGWFYIRAEDGFGLDVTRKAGAIAVRQGGLGDKELDKVAMTGRTEVPAFEGEWVIEFSGHMVSLSRFNGSGFAIAYRTLRDYDPVILFFASLGLLGMGALALRRRSVDKKGEAEPSERSAPWIALAFGIPTFLMFGLYELSTARFYLALIPVTCLLAAFGLSWLCTSKIPGVVTKALVAAGVVTMLTAAVLVARLRDAPDTFELAAQTVEELAHEADPLVYTVEIVGLPLITKPDLFERDALWARGPWDNYQWALMHPEQRVIQGEWRPVDLTGAAPPMEAAERLGRRIMPAPAATRLRVFHAEDKAAATRAALAEADPDIVLISTSRALGFQPLGPTATRDAWKAGVRADGRWQLERVIRNSNLDDRRPIAYSLDFASAFTQEALGPEIEVWTKR